MLPSTTSYTYDVFISYSHADTEWVWSWLIPRLKQAGLAVCTDHETFDIGVPSLVNMENAVAASRHTLLVLTEAWVESQWTRFEALLVQTDDPIGLQRRTLPLMLEKCKPPKRVSIFTYADFTREEQREAQLQRIVDAINDKINLTPAASMPKEASKAAGSADRPASATSSTSSVQLKQIKIKALEDRFEVLVKQYEAANRQLNSTLSAADRVIIEQQTKDLEQELQDVEDKLNQIRMSA